jgi:WD40 repeat protein
VRVWDVAARRQLRKFPVSARVLSLAFSPDGRRVLAAGFSATVDAWDVASGEKALSIPVGSAGPATFTPDGSAIVAVTNGVGLSVSDARTGQEMFSIPLGPGRGALSAHEGGRVATAGTDGFARIFELWDRRELHALSLGLSPAYSVAFSPDGRTLAVGYSTHIVRLWDLDAVERFMAEKPSALLEEAERDTGLVLEGLEPVERAAGAR